MCIPPNKHVDFVCFSTELAGSVVFKAVYLCVLSLVAFGFVDLALFVFQLFSGADLAAGAMAMGAYRRRRCKADDRRESW